VVPYGRTPPADLVHCCARHRRLRFRVLGEFVASAPFARERQALDVSIRPYAEHHAGFLPHTRSSACITPTIRFTRSVIPGPGKSPADSSSTDFKSRHSRIRSVRFRAYFQRRQRGDTTRGDHALGQAVVQTLDLASTRYIASPLRDQNKFRCSTPDRGLPLRPVLFRKTCFPRRPHQRRAPGHRGGYVALASPSTGRRCCAARRQRYYFKDQRSRSLKRSAATLPPSRLPW